MMLFANKWYRIVLIGIPCIALYLIAGYCIVQQSLREHSRYVPRCALVFEATFRNIQYFFVIVETTLQCNSNDPLMQAILGLS